MTLSEYMDKHQMTDQKMSDAVGVSRSAITQYRLGSRMPRPEIMLRLVEVTNSKVSPLDLAMGLRRGK
jgi:transcriptional regulator with XRE-family HTH domain